METIYYRLNATRITAGAQKASGGESLRCVVLPQAPRAGGAGKVISFDAYRRARERAEDRGSRELCPPAAAPERRSGRGRGARWAAADLCATAAIVACTAVTALGVLLT